MQRLPFICSANRLRSSTAGQVFSEYPDVEAYSAGTNNDAVDPLTPEHFEDIDIVFVLEKAHHKNVGNRFTPYVKKARLECLDIPDDYEFMQPALIALLEARAGPHLR